MEWAMRKSRNSIFKALTACERWFALATLCLYQGSLIIDERNTNDGTLHLYP